MTIRTSRGGQLIATAQCRDGTHIEVLMTLHDRGWSVFLTPAEAHTLANQLLDEAATHNNQTALRLANEAYVREWAAKGHTR